MILIDTQKEEFSKLRDIRVFGRISHDDRFNGNLLVIGLGGVGSRTVCNLKGMMVDDIIPEDNIHFLMIDSDIPEMEQTIEDSKEHVGFNALEVLSIYRPNIENILADGIKKNPVHPNLANWMDADFPDVTVTKDGAHGNRQIGRLMFSNAYEDIRMLLFDRLEEIHDKANGNWMDVIIVSSLSGGTGSGILSDLTYNIRAYGKAKKWANLRIGGCLLMPDVIFGNKSVTEDPELMFRMMANGCAALKEVDYYMKLSEKDDAYIFESTTHKLVIRENLFDACMLVSGKKDSQGYLPEGTVLMDTASFLYKLACNKYIGNNDVNDDRKLLRDVFFDNEKYSVTNWKMEHSDSEIATANCYYKVVSEADYKIPIREIENICESDLFNKAYKRLFVSPFDNPQIEVDIKDALKELDDFLHAEPGDEINLSVNGLIQFGQFTKPTYKMIKKHTDGLREHMGEKLDNMDIIELAAEKPKPEFNFKTARTPGRYIFQTHDLVIGYDEPLSSPLNLEMERGQKIVLTGANGIGKSTLLKSILGLIKPLSGDVEQGDYLEIGYFEQETPAGIETTCLEEIWQEFPGYTQYEVRSALAKCGLTTKHIESKVKVLSGGEQAKVRLCKLINRESNILVLDEPTNHLDVDAKDELKRALMTYKGSILMVCHEPEFYDGLATDVWDCGKWTTRI